MEKIRVPRFDGYVYACGYDPGSDMDLCEMYRLRISNDGVDLELVDRFSYDMLKNIVRNLDKPVVDVKELREVLEPLRNFIKAIDERRCPLCGKKMKVVIRRKRRRNEAYFLKSLYPDMKPYDEYTGYWYTCSSCGTRYKVEFSEIDGGAALRWKYEVEKNGKKAVYAKRGYFGNDINIFIPYLEFLKQLFDLGLVEIVEGSTQHL